MQNFIKNSIITRVENATAAGTTAITTEVIDMKGVDEVTFIAALGDVTDTSDLELVCQHGDLSDGSDAADVDSGGVTFTAGASDADNKLLVASIRKPRKRYVRAKLVRATANAVVDSIIAIQTGVNLVPTTQGATVLGSGLALSPASE